MIVFWSLVSVVIILFILMVKFDKKVNEYKYNKKKRFIFTTLSAISMFSAIGGSVLAAVLVINKPTGLDIEKKYVYYEDLKKRLLEFESLNQECRNSIPYNLSNLEMEVSKMNNSIQKNKSGSKSIFSIMYSKEIGNLPELKYNKYKEG